MLVGIPVADTLVSILRRTIGLLENEKATAFTKPTATNHHRLLDLGLSHRKAFSSSMASAAFWRLSRCCRSC